MDLQAAAALTKLKLLWRDNYISIGTKKKVVRSLVISVCTPVGPLNKHWAQLEERTQTFEILCYRRLLNISYKDHVSTEDVRRKIQAAIGKFETPYLGQETETEVAWTHRKVIWPNKDNSTEHIESKTKASREAYLVVFYKICSMVALVFKSPAVRILCSKNNA